MESGGSAARYPSPLRYPGGKGKIANYLKLLIIQNSLAGIRYVEPYAGGASVALGLLFEEYVSNIHINDLNRGVYSFWRFALESSDELCGRISNVALSMDEWKRQKAIHSDPDVGWKDLGFATFYLNRTNRSGIITRGGVIGGNDQNGNWKIDARFNRRSLCARVEKVARFGSRITVSMRNAVDLIRSEAEVDGRLLYLDPPYYVKGARLYDNFYSHEDHIEVCKAVRKAAGPWVVSYDAAPEILEMYSGCESVRYILGYSASKAAHGTEAMFFSADLSVPDVASPARITPLTVARAAAASSRLF
ncbi:DNA adenine methylase [Micromonospora aurantiaca]|nr:DNA adenine methylase [Micromonospora aurantiaca]